MPEYYTHGDEYIVGADEAREIIGALAQQLNQSRGRGMVRVPPPRQIFQKPPLPAGETRPTAEVETYIGIGNLTFVPAGVTEQDLVVEPQESFRITRLVIEVAIDASVTNALIVNLNNASVGARNQSPVTDTPAPASMFRPDATYSHLAWEIAYRNQKIQLSIGVTAAPVAGNVVVSVGAYGTLLR